MASSGTLAPTRFGVWMGLLEAIEGSVPWLLGSNPAVERNLPQEAERRGVTPTRLIFAPRVSHPQYLADISPVLGRLCVQCRRHRQ
jgi:predicted O-linked N-acetylglucosamine transferase (SPINDLY family)